MEPSHLLNRGRESAFLPFDTESRDHEFLELHGAYANLYHSQFIGPDPRDDVLASAGVSPT